MQQMDPCVPMWPPLLPAPPILHGAVFTRGKSQKSMARGGQRADGY